LASFTLGVKGYKLKEQSAIFSDQHSTLTHNFVPDQQPSKDVLLNASKNAAKNTRTSSFNMKGTRILIGACIYKFRTNF